MDPDEFWPVPVLGPDLRVHKFSSKFILEFVWRKYTLKLLYIHEPKSKATEIHNVIMAFTHTKKLILGYWVIGQEPDPVPNVLCTLYLGKRFFPITFTAGSKGVHLEKVAAPRSQELGV
jgi:hypothetical protein